MNICQQCQIRLEDDKFYQYKQFCSRKCYLQYWYSRRKDSPDFRAKHAKRQREYRHKHPEKEKMARIRFLEKNPGYAKEWYDRNRETILAKDKIYYENNKTRIYKNSKARLRERKEWFWNLKKAFYCSKCGEDDYRCLDFHHKDPKDKEKSLSDLIERTASKKRILDEIAKCVALCSNCHRKLHSKD